MSDELARVTETVHGIREVASWLWLMKQMVVPRPDNAPMTPLPEIMAEAIPMTPLQRLADVLWSARQRNDGPLLKHIDRMVDRMTDEDVSTLFAITSVAVWCFDDALIVLIGPKGESAVVSASNDRHHNGNIEVYARTSVRVIDLLRADIAYPNSGTGPVRVDIDRLALLNTLLHKADAPKPRRIGPTVLPAPRR